MKKSGIYVALIIVLLIGAAVISISRLNIWGDKNAAENTPAPMETGDVPDKTPEPAAVTQTPEPVPEETPEVTEPAVTEEPVPVNTPEPTAAPDTSLGQGEFSSDTGTALNIIVNWKAYSVGSGVRLDIDISAGSYSLYTSKLPGSISLTVGGETCTLDSPEISYGGEEAMTTLLASRSFEIPLDSSGKASPDIAVVWNYRGSYGGVELENISAIGTAEIG